MKHAIYAQVFAAAYCENLKKVDHATAVVNAKNAASNACEAFDCLYGEASASNQAEVSEESAASKREFNIGQKVWPYGQEYRRLYHSPFMAACRHYGGATIVDIRGETVFVKAGPEEHGTFYTWQLERA